MIDSLTLVHEVARKAGVELCWRSSDLAYNGEDIAILHVSKIRGYSDIIHDIAHYLCATKRRRKIPNFGLGMSPDDIDFCKSIVSEKLAIDEESRASMLGILIEKHTQMPCQYGGYAFEYQRTWVNHNWCETHKDIEECIDEGPWPEALEQLVKRKYVRESDLAPVFLV